MNNYGHDRNGIPFIGQHFCRQRKTRHCTFCRRRRRALSTARDTHEIKLVLHAAIQELIRFGAQARVKPQILRPIELPPGSSINTRPNVGPTFEIKGARFLGKLTIPERNAFRRKLFDQNLWPPVTRIGKISGIWAH